MLCSKVLMLFSLALVARSEVDICLTTEHFSLVLVARSDVGICLCDCVLFLLVAPAHNLIDVALGRSTCAFLLALCSAERRKTLEVRCDACPTNGSLHQFWCGLDVGVGMCTLRTVSTKTFFGKELASFLLLTCNMLLSSELLHGGGDMLLLSNLLLVHVVPLAVDLLPALDRAEVDLLRPERVGAVTMSAMSVTLSVPVVHADRDAVHRVVRGLNLLTSAVLPVLAVRTHAFTLSMSLRVVDVALVLAALLSRTQSGLWSHEAPELGVAHFGVHGSLCLLPNMFIMLALHFSCQLAGVVLAGIVQPTELLGVAQSTANHVGVAVRARHGGRTVGIVGDHVVTTKPKRVAHRLACASRYRKVGAVCSLLLKPLE